MGWKGKVRYGRGGPPPLPPSGNGGGGRAGSIDGQRKRPPNTMNVNRGRSRG